METLQQVNKLEQRIRGCRGDAQKPLSNFENRRIYAASAIKRLNLNPL